MKITGNDIINKIAARLQFEKKLCHDSAIIRKLNGLTSYEVMQLWSLGDVIQWHNDKIEKEYPQDCQCVCGGEWKD